MLLIKQRWLFQSLHKDGKGLYGGERERQREKEMITEEVSLIYLGKQV